MKNLKASHAKSYNRKIGQNKPTSVAGVAKTLRVHSDHRENAMEAGFIISPPKHSA